MGEPFFDRSSDAIKSRTGRLPLVGREREVIQLRNAIEATFAGQSGVVFLSGDAGIGKSRLLLEAARQMRERDGAVGFGRCLDERGMPPYLPWMGALSELDVDRNVKFGAASFFDFPAQLVGTLDADQSTSTSKGLSPELQKIHLFDSVVRSLSYRSKERPILLMFDDLQWSDESSNQLLRYVAGNVSDQRILILGAYRQEEVSNNAELARTIDELDRQRRLSITEVSPLNERATSALLTGLLGAEDESLASKIHEHSDGNPFFIEEVARSLADSGQLTEALPIKLPLPRGVLAVIQRRFNSTSLACRSVLEVAALIGREFTVSLAADAAERREGEVEELLDEAVRSALISPIEPADQDSASKPDFTFLHDRVREAVAAGINPVRRRAIHGRIAAALESQEVPGNILARLAELVHHFQHARQFDKAIVSAERLGDAAMFSHAHSEAVRAFRLTSQFESERSARTSGTLLLKLGDALQAAGDDPLHSYVDAERSSREAGNLAGAARALQRQGTTHARREEHELALACLKAASETWSDVENAGSEPSGALIELGSVLGLSLGRYDEAIQVGQAALGTVEASGGSPRLKAEARLGLATTLMRAGRLPEGQKLLDPALSLAMQASQPDLAAEIAGALANLSYWLGDLDTSERYARHRRELGIQAGDPYALRHARPWLANLSLSRGDWASATELIREAETDVARVTSPEPRAFLTQLLGLIALNRGDYENAVKLLEDALNGFRQSGEATLSWYIGCLAHAYHAAGDSSSAATCIAGTWKIVEDLPRGSLPRVPSIAQLGIIAVDQGNREHCKRCFDELIPHAGQHHWVLIDRVLASLAASLGDHNSAKRYFGSAAATATRGGIRPEFALNRAHRAKWLLDRAPQSNRIVAERELQSAIESLRTIGMIGAAGDFAQRAGVVAPSIPPAGLSSREMAVLTLLAQGMTNREIGAQLGIAEKTVTNHLTHIFTKANLENRASAVAFAIRSGLVT